LSIDYVYFYDYNKTKHLTNLPDTLFIWEIYYFAELQLQSAFLPQVLAWGQPMHLAPLFFARIIYAIAEPIINSKTTATIKSVISNLLCV